MNAIMAVAMTALELGKSLKTQKEPARPARVPGPTAANQAAAARAFRR